VVDFYLIQGTALEPNLTVPVLFFSYSACLLSFMNRKQGSVEAHVETSMAENFSSITGRAGNEEDAFEN
jgi:hypothetical protein